MPRRFDLFLIHHSKGWLLAVCGFQNESDFVRVSSDVPTVCYSSCGGVYADNEETSTLRVKYVAIALSDFLLPSVLVMEKLVAFAYCGYVDKDGKKVDVLVGWEKSDKELKKKGSETHQMGRCRSFPECGSSL